MEGAEGSAPCEELIALDPHRPVIVISSLFDPLLEHRDGAARRVVPREGRGRRGPRARHRPGGLRQPPGLTCHDRGVLDLDALRAGVRAHGVRRRRRRSGSRSCRSSGGWRSGSRSPPTSRPPSSSPPPAPTAGRRPAPCCCGASTDAGAPSSRATRAARARTWPPTRTARCCSAGCRCSARCTSAARWRPSRREESEAYFATRPRGSQLAAWASHQSSVLADRAELEARFAEAEARFAGEDVPCPPYWGGYRLVPDEIELWQGRANRMHDRLRYERDRHAQPPAGGSCASARRPGARTRPRDTRPAMRSCWWGTGSVSGRSRHIGTVRDAGARRQLELHAAVAREVHGVGAVDAPELDGDLRRGRRPPRSRRASPRAGGAPRWAARSRLRPPRRRVVHIPSRP